MNPPARVLLVVVQLTGTCQSQIAIASLLKCSGVHSGAEMFVQLTSACKVPVVLNLNPLKVRHLRGSLT